MQNKLRVYLGRFSPMHLGHEYVIETMLIDADHDWTNCMIIIGSANTQQSLRHFFSYGERRSFILEHYPEARIAALPDFPNNNDDWFQAISDLITLKGHNVEDAWFYAGCQEDVLILREYTNNFVYCNRFDGTTPIISATQVRDALIHNRSLRSLMNQNVGDRVKTIFNKRWKEFQNK